MQGKVEGKLEGIIGYSFKNPGLLHKALLHPSLKRSAKDFERLEFLGDRVLGLVIASWVYEVFPKESEGHLAKRLASLVCREACECVAQEIQLAVFLKALETEKQTSTSVLSDAMEALIGGIFLDGGLEPCIVFIRRFWEPILYQNQHPPKDPKSKLQEWTQIQGLPFPFYDHIGVEGTQHAPEFFCLLKVDGYEPIQGFGRTKRLAERKAAELFVENYNIKLK